MAVVFAATADLNDLSIWSSVYQVTESSVTARTGTKSYRFGATTVNLVANLLGLYSELYIRLAVDLSSGIRVVLRNSTGTVTTLLLHTGGIKLYHGMSITGTIIAELYMRLQSWDCVECHITRHESTAVCHIKVNGVTVINVTGLNTGALDWDNFMLTPSASGIQYVDDILVDDANWPGLGGIEVVKPSADGTDLAWTSGSYLDVIDDDDATYVATDAEVTAKQSFTIPALAADRKTPTVVCLLTKSQLSGAGAGTLRPYLDANQGQLVGLSTGLQYTQDYQVAYPTEVGLEVVV